MGLNFLWDLIGLPSTKTNKKASVTPSQELAAAEFNLLMQDMEDIRTAYLNGEQRVNPRGATGVSPSGAIRTRVSASGRLEISENGGSFYTPVTRFDVRKYGALGDGVHDDTSAIQAAINAAQSAGGGVVFVPNTGSPYKITAQLLVGVRFVDEADVSLSAFGYPTPSQGYSTFNAASFDSGQADAATGLPAIGFEFEQGSALWWGGSEPAAETAMIYYGVINPEKNGNVTNGYIRGGAFLGPTEYTHGGGFVPTAGLTAVTTNVSGVFVPATAQVAIERCSAWGVRRGFTTSDNYWSVISQCEVFRCLDGITTFVFNASVSFDNIVSYAQQNGYVFTGQGYTAIQCSTEECATDWNVPSSDNYTFIGGYLENQTASHTDYSIKIGQNDAGTNCTWGRIEGVHMSRSVNGKHALMKSVFGLLWDSCRFNLFIGTPTSRSTIGDSQCTLMRFVNSNIPLDAASISSYIQNCSFVGGIYDPTTGLSTWQPSTSEDVRFSLIKGLNASTVFLKSDVADGPSAVAHDLNTTNTLTQGKHARGRNNGTDVWWFNYDGGLDTKGFSLFEQGARVNNGFEAHGASVFAGGTVTFDDRVQTAAGRQKHRQNVNASTVLDTTYEVIDCATDGLVADLVVTLPQASVAGNGFELTIGRNTNPNHTVRILPHSGDGIGRAATSDYITLAPGSWIRISSDGSSVWTMLFTYQGAEQPVSGGTSLTLDATTGTVLCDATSGNITIALPTPSRTLQALPFRVKKTDSSGNTVTITTPTLIDGSASSLVLSAVNAFTVLACNGSDYYVVG